MGWKTITRIKKLKVFSQKGVIALSSLTNGVKWNNVKALSILTGVSKHGNTYGGEVSTIVLGDSVKTSTYKLITTKEEDSNISIYRASSSLSDSNVQIYNNSFTKNGAKTAIGFIRIVCSYAEEDYITSYMIRHTEINFSLHIGGVYCGRFSFLCTGGKDRGAHNLKTSLNLPLVASPTNEDMSNTRKDGYQPTYVYAFNLDGLTNANISLSDVVNKWNKGQGTLREVWVNHTVDIPKIYTYSDTVSEGDNQIITLTYEDM